MPELELDQHTLVFWGRVTSLNNNACGCGGVTANFYVQEGFRGVNAGDHVSVVAGSSGSDCELGEYLKIGDEIIIFTDLDRPSISLCTPHVRVGDYSYRQCAVDSGEWTPLTDDDVLLRLENAVDGE